MNFIFLYSRFLLVIHFIHISVYIDIYTTIPFCPYEFNYLRSLIWVESWSICPSVTGLFHLVHDLKVHPRYSIWQDFLLFKDWIIFHCMYISYHIFSIHSSVEGHLGCFYLLAIVSHATVNMRMQIFTNKSLSLCFQLFLIHTQKWNCWIIC